MRPVDARKERVQGCGLAIAAKDLAHRGMEVRLRDG